MRGGQRANSFTGAATVLGVLVLIVVASVVGAFAFGVVGAPRVVSTESRFGPVHPETTAIRTVVLVSNPNPVGVYRENATITNTVELNGIEVASGEKRGFSLPPGRSTRELTTRMNNGKIPRWWVSHVRNGERTTAVIDTRVYSPLVGDSITVQRRRTIETDLLGSFNSTETRPVNADVPFRSAPVLYVNRTSATWGPVSERETPIEATFSVYNPLRVPIPITELGYVVRMNGVKVGNGTTERPRVLDANRETTVRTTVTIDAERLDEWWVTHLRRNQHTTVTIDFSLRADLPVVGTVALPVDDLTYTTEFETDLLGTKKATTTTTTAAGRSGESAPDPTPTLALASASVRDPDRKRALPYPNGRS